MTLFRDISPYPLVMVVATVAISACLLVASRANAEMARPQSQPITATTLSHCGWLPPVAATFEHNPRSVRILQTKLESLGHSVGDTGIDGLYGKRTKRAVTEFQKRHRLHVDGHMNGETASMLAYLTHPVANVRRCKRPYAMMY